MVVADGGGVGKDFSEGVLGEGGLVGEVKDRLLVEPEGETGGEHLALHAGQFLFDDNHWRASKQRDLRVRSGYMMDVHPSDGQSRNIVHNKGLFLGCLQVQNYTEMSDGARAGRCGNVAYQIPQSVSNFSLWNLTIPFDLPFDQEFDLQLLRLAGTFVFIAKPDFAHSSTVPAEGGVSDGFEIEVGVSAPRSI